MPERIGVVILHWYTEDATTACLRSVVSNGTPEVSLYVVDNGSHSGSRDRMEKEFPAAIFLGDGVNHGFAAGANIGAQRALADGCTHVFLLNSDAVLVKGAIQILSNTPYWIVTPRILSERKHDELWFDGGIISLRGKGVHRDFGRSPDSVSGKPEREAMSFATACALLIRKEAFQRIGMFDECYFAYGEDLDFSIRAGRAQISIGIDRSAVAFHGESQSVRANVGKDFRDYYVIRNSLLVLKKHFRDDQYVRRVVLLLSIDFLFPLVVFLLTFRLKRVRALIAGLQDGCAGRSGRCSRW